MIIINNLNIEGVAKTVNKLKFEMYKLRRQKDNCDISDTMQYINLIWDNIEAISKLYAIDWRISNRYNKYTVNAKELQISFIDNKGNKNIYLYLYDGNGKRRIVAKSDEDVFYTRQKIYNNFEEVENELNELENKIDELTNELKAISNKKLNENEIEVSYRDYKTKKEFMNLKTKKDSYNAITKTIILLKEEENGKD